MRGGKKVKFIDWRQYALTVFLVTLIFLAAVLWVTSAIRTYFFNLIEEETLRYARSYSHSISKNQEAYQTINQLLEEKIMEASQAAALSYPRLSNEVLKKIADTFGVDEIYCYNPKGEIIYTNGKYLGWKAYMGHPVYNFMIGGAESLVEEIRTDTETGEYYKYGYVRLPNNGFIQTGIHLKKLSNFLGSFEIRRILDEIRSQGPVDGVCFLDSNYRVIGCSHADESWVEHEMNEQIQSAIQKGDTYSEVREIGGREYFLVYVPFYLKDSRVGVLTLSRSLAETSAFVRKATILGLVVLTTIFVILLFGMGSTYAKNKELLKLAYFDPLTGLPNREYLKVYLEENQNRNRSAVLLIDLGDFIRVHSIYGYQTGDQLLRELALRLKARLEDGQLLFHFTANSFMLYVADYENQKELERLASQLTTVCEAVQTHPGFCQYMNVNVGIVEIKPGKDVEEILKNATVVLLSVKNSSGEVKYGFFNEQMEAALQREDIIQRELLELLGDRSAPGFFLEYQPKIDLKTNRLVGFEALARMESEEFGAVSPGEFIRIAERSDLIIQLGLRALEEASAFAQRLREEGWPHLTVAVNISGLQLLHHEFTENVKEIIRQSAVVSSQLEFEITESVMLEDFDGINEKFKEFGKMGIKVTIDDFGTGYSCFSRIENIYMDCVKVDKYFIDKILYQDQEKLLLTDLISMCHRLGKKVVAEGVEQEAQRRYLVEHNCDFVQGNLFSKPLPAETVIKKLKNKELA